MKGEFILPVEYIVQPIAARNVSKIVEYKNDYS